MGRKVTVTTRDTSPAHLRVVQKCLDLNLKLFKKPVKTVLLKEESFSEEKSSHTLSVSQTAPTEEELFALLYIQPKEEELKSYTSSIGCQSDLRVILKKVKSLNYLEN